MAQPAVLAALMPAAFSFNTWENLRSALELISEGLRVSLSAVGCLVTGYGVTVAVACLPLAHVTRATPRRPVLTALLAALVGSGLGIAAGAALGGLVLSLLDVRGTFLVGGPPPSRAKSAHQVRGTGQVGAGLLEADGLCRTSRRS
jgi:predicted MFS family arabinose efflux permease